MPRAATFPKQIIGEKQVLPHKQGSSRHDEWLQTVTKGTPSGLSSAFFSKISKLYFLTKLNHSKQRYNKQELGVALLY